MTTGLRPGIAATDGQSVAEALTAHTAAQLRDAADAGLIRIVNADGRTAGVRWATRHATPEQQTNLTVQATDAGRTQHGGAA